MTQRLLCFSLLFAAACYDAHGLGLSPTADGGLSGAPVDASVPSTAPPSADPCAPASLGVSPICDTLLPPRYYWDGSQCFAGCCEGASCPTSYATRAECSEAYRGCGAGCGGEAGVRCLPDEYCHFEGDNCDWADDTGICLPRPTSCPGDLPDAVCGCDHITYDNGCEAAMSGTGVAYLGGCDL